MKRTVLFNCTIKAVDIRAVDSQHAIRFKNFVIVMIMAVYRTPGMPFH